MRPQELVMVTPKSCGFQRKAARYSDLIAATVPI